MNITEAIKAPPIATALATAAIYRNQQQHFSQRRTICYENKLDDCKRIIHEIDKMSVWANMCVHENLSVAHIYLDQQIVHTPTHKTHSIWVKVIPRFSSCSFARQYEFFFYPLLAYFCLLSFTIDKPVLSLSLSLAFAVSFSRSKNIFSDVWTGMLFVFYLLNFEMKTIKWIKAAPFNWGFFRSNHSEIAVDGHMIVAWTWTWTQGTGRKKIKET